MDESESDEDEGSDDGKKNRWIIQKKKEPTAAAKTKKPKEAKVKEDKQETEKDVVKTPVKAVVKEMTPEQVEKRLGELLALRGKRGTDRQEQIENLEFLVQFVKTDAQLTSILMHIVAAQFDATPTVATHMPANLWKGTTNFSIILFVFVLFVVCCPTHTPQLLCLT